MLRPDQQKEAMLLAMKQACPEIHDWFWTGERWIPLCLVTPYVCGPDSHALMEMWEAQNRERIS